MFNDYSKYLGARRCCDLKNLINESKETNKFYKDWKYLDELFKDNPKTKNPKSKRYDVSRKNIYDKTGKVKGSKSVYMVPDIFDKQMDSYFNPAAPPVYISSDILPQGTKYYQSTETSGAADETYAPYYDPLAITPWDMLPPEKQKERLEKYGVTGTPYTEDTIPKNLTSKLSVNTTPIPRLNIPNVNMSGPYMVGYTDYDTQQGVDRGFATAEERDAFYKQLSERQAGNYQLGQGNISSYYDVNRKLAMGGSLSGATGFMYARTGAPSNGPYAKKTKASAENGTEMSYYQNGLDWKPKSISRDGSEVPKNQNAQYVLPRASSESTSLGAPRRDAELLNELARRQAFEKLANQPSIGTAPFQTIDDKRKTKEKKKQIVKNNPNIKLDENDDIVLTNPDRGFEGQPLTPNAKRWDKGMSHFMNAIEATSTITGAGQIGSNLLRLGASGLESQIGRNLVSKNLKNFTSNINPTLNAIDEAGAYVQLDPIGIMGNRLNSRFYNPTTALNTANNTVTGVKNNLTNSAIEGADLILGKNNLKNVTLPKIAPEQELEYRKYQDDLIKNFNTGWRGQYKQGGIVKDDNGYWNPDNWGKVVEIDSPDITMKGVDQDLIGISDEGDVKYMTPGKNYKFKGKKVKEYPVGKNGVNQQDEKVDEQLDQLTNFTNYNKPTKGGWLDKYN